MHEIPLITTIALALSAALFFGLIVRRLGLSPIVGYLIAGVLIGPYTPGVVGDAKIASQLAEIGVILLMFGVGLHFSLKDLLAVRSLAIPGALAQSTAATLACMGLAVAIGWSWRSGLILGIAVSVASTVVMLRALLDHGIVETAEGHIAIGWLVVQDIVTVLVLVLVPAVAAAGSASNIGHTVVVAVGKLALLVAIMMLAAPVLFRGCFCVWQDCAPAELFTLAVLVMAICVATVSYVAFGASMALGAFLGGMVVGQSKVSDQAGADILPMRNVFTVLFFVSVGMLFNWRAVIAAPVLLIGVLGIILVVTPLLAFLIVIVSGHAVKTALTLAAGLGQIGEFSFIVAGMAKSLGLMPDSGHNVVVGAAIISISLNPLIFRLGARAGTAAFEIVLGLRPAAKNSARVRTSLRRSVCRKIPARSSSATARSDKRSRACSRSSRSIPSSSKRTSTLSLNSTSAGNRRSLATHGDRTSCARHGSMPRLISSSRCRTPTSACVSSRRRAKWRHWCGSSPAPNTSINRKHSCRPARPSSVTTKPNPPQRWRKLYCKTSTCRQSESTQSLVRFATNSLQSDAA